ncbi:MAG: formylmethanofuran dehydrogenase [Coriobacteriia bacterium]|nr:formylmethanofuran dehydrogenase [Coriobacteriia bacterium]
MKTFEEDMAVGCAYHGHLCGGIVLGVRMARYACAALGIEDPRQDRDLMVYVEAARCASDGAYAVTGLTIGKRRLKLIDIGRMAMTFVDSRTGKGIRVVPRPEVPKIPKEGDLIAFLEPFSDEELFTVQSVYVDIALEDMPGTHRKAQCEECGEFVMDGREVVVHGRTLCAMCAGKAAYYTVLD